MYQEEEGRNQAWRGLLKVKKKVQKPHHFDETTFIHNLQFNKYLEDLEEVT